MLSNTHNLTITVHTGEGNEEMWETGPFAEGVFMHHTTSIGGEGLREASRDPPAVDGMPPGQYLIWDPSRSRELRWPWRKRQLGDPLQHRELTVEQQTQRLEPTLEQIQGLEPTVSSFIFSLFGLM